MAAPEPAEPVAAVAERDPAQEHIMLSKVLSAAIDPPSADLVELAQELEAEGLGRRLCTEVVERVLMAKLATRPQLQERFKYLRDCSKTCDDVRRDAKFLPSVLVQLPKVAAMLGNYGALSLTCAELFGTEAVAPDHGAATLLAMWERNELPLHFLLKVAEGMEEDDVVATFFSPLLVAACRRIHGRDLTDQKSSEVAWLRNICQSRGPLARVFVKLPVFRPPAPPPGAAAANPAAMFSGMMGGRASGQQPAAPGEGFRLQTESVLGWVLSPTCLDSALYRDKSAKQIHFQNIARKTRPGVMQIQRLLRDSVAEVVQQATAMVNPLLRTDEATRNAVLGWFGSFITGTEARTKSANCLDEGGGPNHFIDSMANGMPMQQNLDMRLQLQLMQARMNGFATPGMAVNTFWALMELVKPIKAASPAALDQFYILQEGPPHTEVLGGFLKESRFGDSDEVAAARNSARDAGLIAPAPKFTAQAFWLALRGLHVLLVPVIKEDFCLAVAAGYFQSRDMAKMEAAFAEHTLNQTIFDSSAFIALLAHLLNLDIGFCLSAAFPERAGDFAEGRFRGTVLPKEVSPQWSVLPSCILEDIVEILEYYITIKPPDQPNSELFGLLNAELVLLLVTFMLGSGEHVKNPNLRGKATTILMSLAKNGSYLHLLETHPVLTGDIIPACIRVFTAVEKTKQSYYDIRMQLKYQLRIPIMELFEKMLPLEAHTKALKTFAVDNAEEFLKFLNQMMNDATMQLEEGMDTLIEIRKLVKEGGEKALERPQAGQLDQDEQTSEGADLYRRSRTDPKEHCKTYMKMGNRTIKTLWSICREAPMVIVTKLNVLQQLLHNCLNSCLDRLVGPRCLELKGNSKDFAEFNFEPKELLQKIAEMYVFVARADKERVQKMITEDGRSYRPKTFIQAVKVLRREGMIHKDMLTDFEQFVQQLNELAKAQEAALLNLEIPDNYLDPIMQEIMEDPVLLPTSKTVMDRKVIERHIMSNDDDPFNRAHLSVKDLEPQPELRAEIQAFCAKHGIALGGDEGGAKSQASI